MFEAMKFAIKPTTQTAVLRLLRIRGDARSLQQVAEEALQEWLEKAAIENPPEAHKAARGYQWKSLFLPEGTLLRFHYQRQVYDAEVRGDDIVFEGGRYSPRQLLLHITGAVRNAWRELWVRSPGDFRWHLADTRRHILRRTPRGLHPRGIDATGIPAANADIVHRASLRRKGIVCEQPRQEADAAQARKPCFSSIQSAAQARAILYRDDIVRDDQPDLTNRKAGGGRVRAGRAGPRDRRYIGHLGHL